MEHNGSLTPDRSKVDAEYQFRDCRIFPLEAGMNDSNPELPALQFEMDLVLPVLGPLLAGTLRVDCTSISLKGTENGTPNEFTGPGYIAQMDTEGFAITIFVAGTLSLEEALRPGGTPGTLMGDAFTLEATDELNRNWRAENIRMCAPEGCVGASGYVVRATCWELVMQRPSGSMEGFSLEVWSRGELPLPPPHHTSTGLLPLVEQPEDYAGRRYRTTVVANTFHSDGFDFAAFHHHGNTCVRAMGKQPLPPNIGPRVWESMLFALAGPLNWSAIRLAEGANEDLRMCSPRRQATSDGSPPILSHLYPPPHDTWQIFDRYLQYVLRTPSKASHPWQLHPLSTQVLSVRSSANTSLEVQSLALTIAVEAVLGDFFLELGKPTETGVAALKDLVEHINAWASNNKMDNETEMQEARKQLRSRASNAIGNFKKASAKDRLRALLSEGATSDIGLKAWKELRNAATHGDWSGLRSNYQKWMDLIGAVRTLFHQIIFRLIGYTGTYTDYGTHGYPLRKHPPNPATGPSPSPDGAA